MCGGALENVPGRGMMAPKVKTLEAYLQETALAPLHIATTIVGACAALALFLGVLGLYGALSDVRRGRGGGKWQFAWRWARGGGT